MTATISGQPGPGARAPARRTVSETPLHLPCDQYALPKNFAQTMNRVIWFVLCTVIGLGLIALGLLVPAQIRAVDARVVELRGEPGPSLVDEGVSLVRMEKTGPARLFLDAAEKVSLPGRERLEAAIRGYEERNPKLRLWGGAAPYLERVFEKHSPVGNLTVYPIVDILVWEDARLALVQALGFSRRPGVLDLMKTRDLTNTVLFPPAKSAAGEPLDTAIATTALLLQQDHLASALADSIQSLAAKANHGEPAQDLELAFLDLLGLGKRLDWVQLTTLLRSVPDSGGLQQAAHLLRDNEEDLASVYAAIHFAGSPALVAKYLAGFPATGMKDLRLALRAGRPALRDLLERQQPVHYATTRDRFTRFQVIEAVHRPLARITSNSAGLGFALKYGLCLCGALFAARAFTYLSPSLADEIVGSCPLVTGPQLALALCLLFVVLFFTESRVAWAAPPKAEPRIRLSIPMASPALRAAIPNQVRVMIDKLSVASLLVFFVLQAAIYVACRMKLAEIRRQSLSSRLKLRLLENEEHLFDAGLYFGFVGTVLSLILVSLGVVKFSLMAAYSSTSFGIIFVSIVKIFHVRPYRRRLILDAETAERQVQLA